LFRNPSIFVDIHKEEEDTLSRRKTVEIELWGEELKELLKGHTFLLWEMGTGEVRFYMISIISIISSTNSLSQEEMYQISLSHKDHAFGGSFATHESNQDSRCRIAPTEIESRELPLGFVQNYKIRVFIVSKRVARLDSDVLRVIFDFFCDSHNNPRWRNEEITKLCLTCREWRRVSQSYLPVQKILGINRIYPDLIWKIDFQAYPPYFSHNQKRNEFTKEAWAMYRREFLEIFSRVSGTSVLSRIDFNERFNDFHPSEWSNYLRRCYNLRNFSFQDTKCIWDDVKEFLVTFQHNSQVLLDKLSLDGIISNLRGQDYDRMVGLRGNQVIKVQELKISRVRSKDLLIDILSVISPNLERVGFDRTSLNIECATTLLDFLSSSNGTNLTSVNCSLMPPDLIEFISSPQSSDVLSWPLSKQTLGIFSSLRLAEFTFDGGAFGISTITSHHISIFGQIPNLRELSLRYCLGDVQPTSFSSLADLDGNWKSLEHLDITYAFGDPNWEREQIDRLFQYLQSTKKVHIGDEVDGSLFARIIDKETWRSVRTTLREGGNENDDWSG
jgi:hypothetical protein